MKEGGLSFRRAQLPDGSCKSTFGDQEMVGGKDLILLYESNEAASDRMTRLETMVDAMRVKLEDVQVLLKDVQHRLDTSEEVILCGEIAYFVDQQAGSAVYGAKRAASVHKSIGGLQHSDLKLEERGRLDKFLAKFGEVWNVDEIIRVTRVLRDKRYEVAHLPVRARVLHGTELRQYIARHFADKEARKITSLLDEVIRLFSTESQPLMPRSTEDAREMTKGQSRWISNM
ncbi:g894 [Coccomyxa elongata]